MGGRKLVCRLGILKRKQRYESLLEDPRDLDSRREHLRSLALDPGLAVPLRKPAAKLSLPSSQGLIPSFWSPVHFFPVLNDTEMVLMTGGLFGFVVS